MSSYVSNLVRFVWGTANRKSYIKPYWQDRLYEFIGGILRQKKAKLLEIGGISDHVHIYASLPSNLSLAQAANVVKSNSSRWVHETFPHLGELAWQEGYGAFSVSKSVEESVTAYIANQEQHRRGRDFDKEFMAILDRHGMQYDPNELW